jgi:hypothetical protein
MAGNTCKQFCLIMLALLMAGTTGWSANKREDRKIKRDKQDEKEEQSDGNMTIQGMVSVDYGSGFNPVDIKVYSDDGKIQHIKLDSGGKKLGKSYNYMVVRLSGKEQKAEEFGPSLLKIDSKSISLLTEAVSGRLLTDRGENDKIEGAYIEGEDKRKYYLSLSKDTLAFVEENLGETVTATGNISSVEDPDKTRKNDTKVPQDGMKEASAGKRWVLYTSLKKSAAKKDDKK